MQWFISSSQDGLAHDTEGKARLVSSPSLHKGLSTLKVRYISLVKCSYLCVLVCA